MRSYVVEDRLSDNTSGLVVFCKELLRKGKGQEAKGVWIRHSLGKLPPIEVGDLADDMRDINYDPAKDPRPEDKLKPVTQSPKCYQVREDVAKI